MVKEPKIGSISGWTDWTDGFSRSTVSFTELVPSSVFGWTNWFGPIFKIVFVTVYQIYH